MGFDWSIDSYPVLGLDISKEKIIAVQLRLRKGVPYLEDFHLCDIPSFEPIVDDIQRIQSIRSELIKLYQRESTIPKHIAIAISSQLAISKVMEVPNHLSGLELELHIETLIEALTPLPLSDIHYDYEPLEHNESHTTTRPYLISTVSQQATHQQLSVVAETPFIPVVLDIAPFAIVNGIAQLIPSVNQFLCIKLDATEVQFIFKSTQGMVHSQVEPVDFIKSDSVELWTNFVMHYYHTLPFYGNYRSAPIYACLEPTLPFQILKKLKESLSADVYDLCAHSTLTFSSLAIDKQAQKNLPNLLLAIGLATRGFHSCHR